MNGFGTCGKVSRIRANAQRPLRGANLIPNRGQVSGGICFGLRRQVAAFQSADMSAHSKSNGVTLRRDGVATCGNGFPVQTNGAAIHRNGVPCRNHGASVHFNGVAVCRNGAPLCRLGAGICFNGAAIRDDGVRLRRMGVAIRRNGVGLQTNGVSPKINGFPLKKAIFSNFQVGTTCRSSVAAQQRGPINNPSIHPTIQ